jgi:TRAP-type C4-dicarboxylate transport system permease small subunit
MTRSWLNGFDRGLQVVAGFLVVVLLGTVTAGIVSRALNHPLSWTDEGSGFLMVWLSCLGWMIATRRGAHIRIRFFQDKLGATPKRSVECAIQVGIAVMGGVVAWYAVHLVRTNSDIEAMALPLSVAWMYVPLLPAGALTLLQALADLRGQLQGGPPLEGSTP